MTRTSYSLPDMPLFAVAGVWRTTAEWGDAYSMVMANACIAMAGVHNRMPVILHPDDWAQWVGGSTDEAMELCEPWHGQLIVDKTADPWVRPKSAASAL